MQIIHHMKPQADQISSGQVDAMKGSPGHPRLPHMMCRHCSCFQCPWAECVYRCVFTCSISAHSLGRCAAQGLMQGRSRFLLCEDLSDGMVSSIDSFLSLWVSFRLPPPCRITELCQNNPLPPSAGLPRLLFSCPCRRT